jgi:hypothetical protein
VVCEKCGQIDSAPNGVMMEASAKIHAEKCGNNVLIGPKYKPNRELIHRSEWEHRKELQNKVNEKNRIKPIKIIPEEEFLRIVYIKNG